MITQEDRDLAADLHIIDQIDIRRGLCDHWDYIKKIADYRIAAEKAVLDRLRNLPDDAALALYHAADIMGIDLPKSDGVAIASALADILEQQP